MSSSKKKLQRREAVDTKKVDQEKAKQAAYKKKARTYTAIGIIVVVLVAVLLIWSSGIFQRNATAATVGDVKISVGELSYYYYANDVRNLYGQYGLLNTSLGDDEQIFDEAKGTTFQDMFLETALTQAQNTVVVYLEALDNGYTDADVKEAVDAEVSGMKSEAASYGYTYDSYLIACFGRYMTPAIYERVLTQNLLADLYFNDVYSTSFDSYTQEDLDAYYAKNPEEVDTYTYSYLLFTPASVSTTGADGQQLSDEEIAELEAKALSNSLADAELAQADFHNNGRTVAELIASHKPASSVEYTSVDGAPSINAVFRDELLELDEGESVIVKYEDYGYYLVISHGHSRSDELSMDVRHILFTAETTVDAQGNIVAPTKEAWDAAYAEAESALAEYEAGALTGEAFGALAEKYSDDGGSNTNGGLYEGVLEGNFVSELNDWMFGDETRTVGETAIIRHEGDAENESSPYWGYHVIYVDGFGEPAWQLAARDTLASKVLSDLTDSLMEEYPAALAPGAYNIGK